jgi:hypothetical protein
MAREPRDFDLDDDDLTLDDDGDDDTTPEPDETRDAERTAQPA